MCFSKHVLLFFTKSKNKATFYLQRSHYTTSMFLLNTFKVLVIVLQEGRPLPGTNTGLCLTLGNELSEETHVLTKHEILLGKGTQVESSRVSEPRRTALPQTDSESFLVVQALFSQLGCQRGFWEVFRHVVLLLTFPELFRLVVAY